MSKASQGIQKRNESIWLPTLLLEVVSIIIAVLLALGVNEWRESRAHKKLADQALATIHDEIIENKKLFETILPRHRTLLDTLIQVDTQIKNDELSEDDERAELQFVPLFVQNTAWQTALATEALLHIPYEIVQVLSEVYTFQESYTKVTDYFIKAVFEIDNHRDDLKSAQRQFAISALETFVTYEEAMPMFYNRALTAITGTAQADGVASHSFRSVQ